MTIASLPRLSWVTHCTFDYVRHDLHIAVRLRAVPVRGRDAVFVHHPQGAKPHVPGVDVLFERKGVAAVEPADARAQSFAGSPDGDH